MKYCETSHAGYPILVNTVITVLPCCPSSPGMGSMHDNCVPGLSMYKRYCCIAVCSHAPFVPDHRSVRIQEETQTQRPVCITPQCPHIILNKCKSLNSLTPIIKFSLNYIENTSLWNGSVLQTFSRITKHFWGMIQHDSERIIDGAALSSSRAMTRPTWSGLGPDPGYRPLHLEGKTHAPGAIGTAECIAQ
jgi:hypothetical protein